MVPDRNARLLLESSHASPPLVMGILPKADRELDRLDRLLAIQRHRLAVGLDLLAAPGPQIGIPEARGIAESVAERLAEGTALGFELLTGRAVLFPSLRELFAAIADFLEPGFAIGDQSAAGGPRDADPFPATLRRDPRDPVQAAFP